MQTKCTGLARTKRLTTRLHVRVQSELEKEAQIMSALDNSYIIRMIGLCKSDWMLILEFAPLGPLKNYLRQHRRY